MSVKNALWIIFFCLSFIGLIMWGFGDMESEIENHYKGKVKKVEVQKDSIQKVLDSVQSETFRMNIDLGRYEVAFEIFASRNPKAAEELAKIISEETE